MNTRDIGVMALMVALIAISMYTGAMITKELDEGINNNVLITEFTHDNSANVRLEGLSYVRIQICTDVKDSSTCKLLGTFSPLPVEDVREQSFR